MQMANHLPGRAHLTREDLLDRELKKRKTHSQIFKCFLDPREFYSNTLRLYIKKECQTFFTLAKSKKFRRMMRRRTLYTSQNLDSDKESPLDFIELLRLNKLYKRGEECGKVKAKNFLREYIWKQLHYRNGHKFRIRAFMTVFSTNPLKVAFHRGYTVLDRFNNSISFTDASISHSELFEYLQEESGMSQDQFDSIFEKIKKISALLNFLAVKKFLKDSRFFQNFALDFIIDRSLQPWLVDVKGAPDYMIKNGDFVKNLLTIVHNMNQARSGKIANFANNIKHSINRRIDQKQLVPMYWSEFVPAIRKIIAKDMDGFKDLLVNTLPNDSTLAESGFETIYDETLEGHLAYKGIIDPLCM